jgi:hypothetical protein
MKKKVKAVRIGYRVDVQSDVNDAYIRYSGSKETPLTLDMAESLAAHLKLAKAGGRIVEVYAETVVAEWLRGYTPQPDGVRARVQALRVAAGFAEK